VKKVRKRGNGGQKKRVQTFQRKKEEKEGNSHVQGGSCPERAVSMRMVDGKSSYARGGETGQTLEAPTMPGIMFDERNKQEAAILEQNAEEVPEKAKFEPIFRFREESRLRVQIFPMSAGNPADQSAGQLQPKTTKACPD